MNSTRCPRCGRKSVPCGELFRCKSCGALHDGDPNEGGDFSHNPSARLEREERAKARRQQPRGLR